MGGCPTTSPTTWRSGANVVVTFDEGNAATHHVLTVALGPGIAVGAADATRYNHSLLLVGIETYFGLPKLKHAATATPLPI